MYDDRPERDTPQKILDELREYGGESPDGQPIWRIVRAENCRIHCFGRQNHIARGIIAAIDDYTRPESIVPDRIEEGEFWIPRYGVTGWILERWFPGSCWGTREKWESEKAQDGRTRLFAAYPQRGAYQVQPCGPWAVIPPIEDIKGRIRHYNAQQRTNPVNWANHTLAWTAFDAQARQKAADAFADELEAKYRMGVSGMLRTASGSAQEFRDTLAAQVQGVHLGSAEKWG